MTTELVLARIGTVLAPAGAIVLVVATILHPSGADPNDLPAAFAEYAADGHWVWTHLAQFAGFVLLMLALAALAGTLEFGRARAWARLGLMGVAASIAVAASLQAVDGVALKAAVDRWAAASGEARSMAFEGAFAVRHIEIGLASLLSLTSGITVALFGVALLWSARYPAWFAGLGLLGGLGTFAAGLAQAFTGFSGLAMMLSLGAGMALAIWAVVAGALMWRLAATLGPSRQRS